MINQPNLLDDCMHIQSEFTSDLKQLISSTGQDIKPAKPPLITLLKQTKDASGNIRTIEQNMRLGKWLKQVCPDMQDTRIKYLVENYIKSNAVLSSYRVELTTDYEGIYSVPLYYMESEGRSCMTDNLAVKTYARDNRLRLWTVYNAEDELCGRSLVRLDKKEYIRLYIDKNLINPLNLLALIEKEYVLGNLEGITLEYLEDGEGSFYCPYLDGSANSVTIVNEQHLIISKDGDYCCDSSGLISLDKTYCYYCDDTIAEGDCYHTPDGDTCCEYCYHDNYCYCGYEGEDRCIDDCIYIDHDNLPKLADRHGAGFYSKDWLEENMLSYL